MQTPGEISWIIERSLIHLSDLFCCPYFLCLHVVVVYDRVVCVCYVNSSGLPRLHRPYGTHPIGLSFYTITIDLILRLLDDGRYNTIIFYNR